MPPQCNAQQAVKKFAILVEQARPRVATNIYRATNVWTELLFDINNELCIYDIPLAGSMRIKELSPREGDN
jgi:hypothetical protein